MHTTETFDVWLRRNRWDEMRRAFVLQDQVRAIKRMLLEHFDRLNIGTNGDCTMQTNASSPLSAILVTRLDPETYIGSHRTGTLSHIGEGAISARLGFDPAYDVEPGKTDQEWKFRVGDVDCAIWDMKGSGRRCVWSTFGPAEVFTALFGWRAVTPANQGGAE